MDIGDIAELAHIKLQRGQVLVLVGPQGSGKTTFAEIISAMNGCCDPRHAGIDSVIGKFNGVLADAPIVVIIDVADLTVDHLHRLRPLIASTRIPINRKFVASGEIPTPLFIITTHTAPELDADDRRFNVVTL